MCLFSNKNYTRKCVNRLQTILYFAMEIWKKVCPTKKVPVKVTDQRRSRRVGLVVSSLSDVKKKANDIFNVTDKDKWESLCVCLEDGTEIVEDNYLRILNDKLLIVSSSQSVSMNPGSLEEAMEKYLKAVWELKKFNSNEVFKFLESNKDEKIMLTWQYVSTLSASKSHLSSIKEHPEWFTGCNKLVTSKEEYFRKCAQGRIRSYLRDAKSRLSQNKLPDHPVSHLKNLLEIHKYFACYFDRADQSVDRMCDSNGHFQCQGQYNKEACQDSHRINPYDNAESRILFSTWNLDHIIERVKILSDLCSHVSCNEDCDYTKYFDLLFTRKNLKLVHKNCHVIGPHTECQIV